MQSSPHSGQGCAPQSGIGGFSVTNQLPDAAFHCLIVQAKRSAIADQVQAVCCRVFDLDSTLR